MRLATPSAYLPDNFFSGVENHLVKRRVAEPKKPVPPSEIVSLDLPIRKAIQYLNVALQSELRFRKIPGAIRFCVYESYTPDAFTFLHNGIGVIVISTAMLAYNYHVSYALLSTRPLVECTKLNLTIELDFPSYLSVPRDENRFPALTLDEMRHFSAIAFGSLASASIIYHEAAHVIDGHLRLVADDPGFASRSDVRRALEHDADCYTVPSLVRLTRFINGRGGQKLVTGGANIVMLATAAAALPYCAASIGNVRNMDLNSGGPSHPPGGQRFWSIFGVGQRMLELGLVPAEDAGNMMTSLNIAMTDAAALVFGLDNRLSASEMVREIDKRLSGTGEAVDTWRVVRPRLEPFKIGLGKLAPIQERDRSLESIARHLQGELPLGWNYPKARYTLARPIPNLRAISVGFTPSP